METTKFFRKANESGTFAIECGAQDGKPVIRARSATSKWGTWKSDFDKIKFPSESEKEYFREHIQGREDLDLSELFG